MNVASPVNGVHETELLISAGASELYCGYLPRYWIRKYTPVGSLNRREWADANLKDISELEEIVGIAHDFGVTVSLGLNAQYYSEKQVPDLRRYVDETLSAGVDSYLVSDIGLLRLLREDYEDVALHLSSVAHVYNSLAAGFYERMGVRRIILPRHLTVDEIKKVVKGKSKVEFEAFILYNRCANCDGLCTFQHGSEEYGLGANACSLDYKIIPVPPSSRVSSNIEYYAKSCLSPQGFMDNIAFQCGLCALYEFKRLGLHSVKIIGRSKPLWMKLLGVRLTSFLIGFLDENPTKSEFTDTVKGIVEYDLMGGRIRTCTQYNCYYPEML
ncbi:MAG: U32 family peptidase [Candidatus Altiarchaeota archaeon]